jgi:hypothetical protein
MVSATRRDRDVLRNRVSGDTSLKRVHPQEKPGFYIYAATIGVFVRSLPHLERNRCNIYCVELLDW